MAAARALRRLCLVLWTQASACTDDAPEALSSHPALHDGATSGADGAASDAGREPIGSPDAAPALDAAPAPTRDATSEAAPGASEGGTHGPDAALDPPAPCSAFVQPADCPSASETQLPAELRCTGLYGAWAKRELACGVLAYQPAFQLWSDGAEKRRYVALPAGARVDVSDPNDFVYPVGTQFWKEFHVPSAQGARLGETRLLRKSARGWLFTSYVWSADGQSAQRTDDGVHDLFGTGHTVPSRQDCQECHAGRPDFVLGWDWLMLGPGATGLTRDVLLARGLLSAAGAPAQLPAGAEVPGDAIEREALGYLHANCGVACHNQTSRAAARDAPLEMRLEIGELGSVLQTDAARTGINHAPNPIAAAIIWGFDAPITGYYDFRPGDPARSYAVARMGVREFLRQMPQLGSNRVDERGVRTISDWVQHMTAERGYPPAAP
jgi:hypothetical protein